MVRNFKDNFDKVRKTMLELPLNYVWKWNNADQGEPKNFVTYGPDPDCKKYSILIELAFKETSPKQDNVEIDIGGQLYTISFDHESQSEH